MFKKKAVELQKLRTKIINILRKRSGLSIKQVKELMDNGENYGTHFFADEALRLGLIDKIVRN